MRKPDPLGRVPLVLREDDVTDPRNGELLLNYSENYLYYVDRKTGEKIGIADAIYKQLISSIASAKLNIVKSDGMGTEDPIPDIKDRKMNNWYFNIKLRSQKSG